jgi:hypothetical protein
LPYSSSLFTKLRCSPFFDLATNIDNVDLLISIDSNLMITECQQNFRYTKFAKNEDNV